MTILGGARGAGDDREVARSGIVGPRLAAALFVLAVMLTLWNLLASTRDHDRVAGQNEVVLNLERLLSAARDMETGARGYVLAGSDEYLSPYQTTLSSLTGVEGSLRAAWVATGGRGDALTDLFDKLEIKRAYTTRLVQTRRDDGFDAARAVVATGEGRRTMDALRADVAVLQDGVIRRRQTIERADRIRSLALTSVSTAAALAACAVLGWIALQRRRKVLQVSSELAGLGDRFRTLADNIPQLAWMADATGNLYWYNQRWYDYTGTTPEEMKDSGWRNLHDPAYLDGAAERFAQAIAAGVPWEDTFPLRGRDGTFRWFLSRAQPVRDAQGKVVRWFGTNTDVSAQRAQEQELAAAKEVAEEANRAKSQFLANMSHELRTPLSAVIGYSEMMEEEVEEMGERHLLEDLAKIKSNARHLLSLINDVLDISKIEANKMEVYAETFDVAAVIEDVASTVGSLVQKKENRLVVGDLGGLGTMHSDVVKVRQILINFLSNAAKFTERGEIRLDAKRSATPAGETVTFSVRDSGLGMNEEQVSRLFQRFNQADASTTRRFGGTGLGLAITRAFTEMLGGSVAVESRVGEGSLFSVTVPAELPRPAEAAPAATAHHAAAGEDVILVIDDDNATRELLTRFLTREGFTVRTADDGLSGLALAQTLKPRIILLDVTMPRMDGWEVLRRLKHDPHLSAIPVIMCTIIDEQNLGFSLGASDYLLKPVNWEQLRDALSRMDRLAAKGDVLVVDDDADTRERLNGLFAREGWTVTEAENGLAALEAVDRRVPSLVLLDLNMPEMDGFTFLRAFRARPERAQVPVIVMTARDLSAGERAELKGGGARVLEKGRVGMRELADELHALTTVPAPRGTVTEHALAE